MSDLDIEKYHNQTDVTKCLVKICFIKVMSSEKPSDTYHQRCKSKKKESNLTSSLFKNIFNEISSKALKAKIVSMQCDVSEYIATIVSNVESIVTSVKKWRKCDRK